MMREKFKAFLKKDFCEKTNILAFLFFCLFLLDCSISGGGRYFNLFGLSVRMIWGILSVLFSIPTLWNARREHAKNPIHWIFLAFILWFSVSLIRGYTANNNLEVLVTDVKGFMYLFLVPIAMNCVINRKRVVFVMDVLLVGAFLQAMFVFIVNVMCSIDIEYLKVLYHPFIDLKIGTVSVISNSIFRIFMSSGPYLIIACIISIMRLKDEENNWKKYAPLTAFYLNAILLSYTRSLYGSAGITAIIVSVVFCIAYPKVIKKFLQYVVLTVACLAFLIFSQEFIFEANYFNFALSRTLGTEVKLSVASTLQGNIKDWLGIVEDDDNSAEKEAQEEYLDRTESSDQLRKITETELIKLFQQHPLVGNGLGACSQTRNGPDEYFYLDVLARMGIIGLCLYFAPYFYMIYMVIKNKAGFTGCSFLIPFWIASGFNPWMNAALGIAIYAVAGSVVCAMGKKAETREIEHEAI